MPAHSDGPARRTDIKSKALFDFINQIERVPAVAIHLVDERRDGHVAKAAHLKKFQCLRLNAFGAVHHP